MTTVLITTGRADFTSVAALCIELARTNSSEWCLLVSGDHNETTMLDWATSIEIDLKRIRFGPTWQRSETTEIPLGWLGDFTTWIGKTIESLNPSLVVLVGDRSELLPAASAALTREIPIAHFSGGDLTLGSTDNQVRFALSMMATYHLVSNQEHANRLTAIGVCPEKLFICGEPALSLIPAAPLYPKSFFLDKYGLYGAEEFALMTYHPPAMHSSNLEVELNAVLTGLNAYSGGLLVTASNGDPRASIVHDLLNEYARQRENVTVVEALGPIFYYEAMHHAQFMIGNSSSGMWEAPTLGLPVINIGNRQKGRIRGDNVIDVSADPCAIHEAIESAVLLTHTPGHNPYGTHNSAAVAVDLIASIENANFDIRKQSFPTIF